jgi:hypothetical protein
MSTDDFITKQRNGVKVVFRLFTGFLTVMWGATLLDIVLNLGWEMDARTLWIAPLMVAFAAALRFVGFAIFRFVEENY